MKLLKLIVLSLSSLLLIPLVFVESSASLDDTSASNITRGSTLSLNDNSPTYWLSPSGNIAFGFYQLPWSSDRYIVGIWFVKSPSKTLVWTANPNDLPLHKPSSIVFTDDGKLMLQIMPDNKEKSLLPDIQVPVSYAKMHDNGNFVLYNSKSQIVWESFDYPTDTILGGQKLKAGIDLISGNYRLSVRQTDGFVAIYKKTNYDIRDNGGKGNIIAESVSVMSDTLKDSLRCPVILSLDTTGKLYLASFDDAVVKVFYPKKKRKQQVKEEGDYMYRATLSSIGRLNLRKERIDGNDNGNEKSASSIVWSSYKYHTPFVIYVLYAMGGSLAALLALVILTLVISGINHFICMCKQCITGTVPANDENRR